MNIEEDNLSNAQQLRLKAEEKLREKHKNKEFQIRETDTKKLLHELYVHQIELELQNEELQEAFTAAETALKKYTILYDFAPVGYFTLDVDGNILELNFTGADILGDRRFVLVNKNFKLFVSDESKPVFSSFLSKVYITNAKEMCEVRLGYDDKHLSRVYIEGIVTGDKQNCLLSVMDITGLNKQEKV